MRTAAADETLRQWRNILACLGLGAIAAFVAALVLLHLAAGGDAPGHMSEFANSRFGLLWALSLYTVVVGGAMVVWALKPCLRDCPSKWIGIAMLWLAGAGAVPPAAFPADDTYVQTFSGKVHNDAALGTFALLGAAMVVLAPAFRASPGMGAFAKVSVLLGVLVTASWVTYLVTTLEQVGVHAPAQRVLVALITTWFVLLGLQVRNAARRPVGRLRSIVLAAAVATPMPAPPAPRRRRKPARKAAANAPGKTARPRAARPTRPSPSRRRRRAAAA